MRQPMFAQFPGIGIDARNLLEARMIITPYNQHVRLLSSEPFGWFAPPKSTRAWEPTLFMESLRSLTLNGALRRGRIGVQRDGYLNLRQPQTSCSHQIFPVQRG